MCSQDDYKKLIEFLTDDFLKESIYRSGHDEINFARIKKDVEAAFDIITTKRQFNNATWIKRYAISEKNGHTEWDIGITTADVLYVNHMRKYREQLLAQNNIHPELFMDTNARPCPVSGA